MAIRYGRGDVKQTTTGFRGPLMVQSLTSAKSKFLSLDFGSPINTYGVSKLKSEKVVQEAMPYNATIIRTSWLFSEYGNNFVKTILKLSRMKDKLNVVSDQVGSPTYAHDLAEVIINIIQNKSLMSSDYRTQIYHYSNSGQCSWHELSKEIIKLSKSSCDIVPINTEDYLTEAKRAILKSQRRY